MFLRNHTLKQSNLIDTMPALNVFSSLTSALMSDFAKIGNLSIAQLALRSKVSLKTALDTSSQVYLLDTAKRQRNSPMFGQAFLVRNCSSRKKVAICSQLLLGDWGTVEG